MQPEISHLSIKELEDLIDSASSLIQAKKAAEIEDLKSELAQKAADHGFDINELFGAKSKSKAKREPTHRDPNNPDNTWAGRGAKPKWLREAIERGASTTDFEI